MIIVAGPCTWETHSTLEITLERLLEIMSDKEIDFYFKASFLKDNRTKARSFQGPGAERLEEFLRLKDTYRVKLCTDFHNPEMIREYSKEVDLIQIPAFLSKQTSLLREAGLTNKKVNIKRGQFVSPEEIKESVKKTECNNEVFLTERGTVFGYDEYFVDPRNVLSMKRSADKVLADITHPTKNHSKRNNSNNEEILNLGSSMIAAGVDGLFIETQYDASMAKCDGDTMLDIQYLPLYLEKFYNLYKYMKGQYEDRSDSRQTQ